MGDTKKIDVDKLAVELSRIPPDKLREAAIKAGLQTGSPSRGIERLANGEMRVTVILPAEVANIMTTWAESAEESLEEFCARTIPEAITAFTFAQWDSEPAPPPVVAKPA